MLLCRSPLEMVYLAYLTPHPQLNTTYHLVHGPPPHNVTSKLNSLHSLPYMWWVSPEFFPPSVNGFLGSRRLACGRWSSCPPHETYTTSRWIIRRSALMSRATHCSPLAFHLLGPCPLPHPHQVCVLIVGPLDTSCSYWLSLRETLVSPCIQRRTISASPFSFSQAFTHLPATPPELEVVRRFKKTLHAGQLHLKTHVQCPQFILPLPSVSDNSRSNLESQIKRRGMEDQHWQNR